MCGRFAKDYTWKDVHAFLSAFDVDTPANDPEPAYNVAPTQACWVITPDGNRGVAEEMIWGLLPVWAKDKKIAYSTINARLETVAEKPAFRGAWKAGRRCLVLASGYYEWPVPKTPSYIHIPGSNLMVFGGIWEARRDEQATFSIVTKEPDPIIASLHDRMPLILPPEMCWDWMTGSADDAMGIAMTAPEPPLTYYRVDPAVGNVRNQGPRLIEPIQV